MHRWTACRAFNALLDGTALARAQSHQAIMILATCSRRSTCITEFVFVVEDWDELTSSEVEEARRYIGQDSPETSPELEPKP
jgi:hypothetical protein